jgi:hypothetical protein
MQIRHCVVAAVAATVLSVGVAGAGVVAYGTGLNGGLAGFNAAAGNPPVVIDFESIAIGTDLDQQTVAGLTFEAAGAPLIVVDAASTSTDASGYVPGSVPNPSSNTLPATSGRLILSPGGALMAAGTQPDEIDNIHIRFDTPVRAFGFDLLSQSADGFSFITVTALDENDAPLVVDLPVPISDLSAVLDGGDPAGADFFGLVSDSANIKTIFISDFDHDDQFPDNNIGIDTLRVAGGDAAAVPLPSAAALAVPLLGALAVARGRRRSRA